MSDHPEPTPQLSEREQQVLALLVTGASNQQIAEQLVISINTVKVHVRKILSKLGVQSRTEAAHLAIAEGLVSVDAPVEETTAPMPPKAGDDPVRSYLLATVDGLPMLAPWQQMYVAGALVLAAVVLLLPLRVPATSLPGEAPAIPVIFAAAPTATPAFASSSWRAEAPMLTERANLAVAAVDARIFAIGGRRDNNQATRQVEIYDSAENAWVEATSNKPTAVESVTAAVVAAEIYVPGGCTSNRQAVGVLEILKPELDTWRTGASLPEPRCGYGLVVVEDKLYLFGGWDGTQYVDSIFVFTPATETWTVLDQTLPRPTGYMGVAVAASTIYVVGGYNDEQEFVETYAFDPASETLEPRASLLEPRGGLGLISDGTNLYAIGGFGNQSIAAEQYNPANDSWMPFDAPFPHSWSNMGLAVLGKRIYAVGGWDSTQDEYMNDLISYQFLYQHFLPVTVSE